MSAGGDATGVRLRLWPGVALAILTALLRYALPVVTPDAMALAMMGGLAGSLLILVWWALFSRAERVERWGAVLLIALGLLAGRALLDESMATAGMGILFLAYALPVAALCLVGWAVVFGDASVGRRRTLLVCVIVAACGVWTLVRTGGISNQGDSDFAWRWSPTAEERLLTTVADETLAGEAAGLEVAPVEWPGFRGAGRDGVVRGVRIATDWTASPPREVWRRPIGPGWSSFAVRGEAFFTQEQRGEEEVVSAYRLATGEPIWRHVDRTRFWESNAGAGPRATPTLSGDRLFSFGGTGLLNALQAAAGARVWARDVGADAGIAVPTWGFSSSPLIVGDLVVVAAVGKLAAYDRETGEPRWFGPDGGDGYSSPHLLEIDGEQQILLASRSGVVAVAPASGEIVWEHAWPGGTRIVQPAVATASDLLVSRGGTTGIRRVALRRTGNGWESEERWTTNRLKPYFSDFVVHEGSAYGFDGNILASIDLLSGDRNWKGGRYGSGQLVLLADQDVLLVVSEKGGLALVGAVPDGFTELARLAALEGKTWNHPVLVGDLLLLRNSEEMAAFRLALAAD